MTAPKRDMTIPVETWIQSAADTFTLSSALPIANVTIDPPTITCQIVTAPTTAGLPCEAPSSSSILRDWMLRVPSIDPLNGAPLTNAPQIVEMLGSHAIEDNADARVAT